jgi:hypothetical protein
VLKIGICYCVVLAGCFLDHTTVILVTLRFSIGKVVQYRDVSITPALGNIAD